MSSLIASFFTKSGRTLIALVALISLNYSTQAAMADEAASLAGHWEGAVAIPGARLDFKMDFELTGEVWSGTIDIPKQGAKGLPLKGITVEGAKVSFMIADVPGDPKFDGTMSESGDEISGAFAQGGLDVTFSMKRVTSRAPAAREALAGFDEFIDQAIKDWKVPGLALGIVVDGEVVLAKGYGLRDREKELPITSQTLFAIGSSSKAFTTFLLGLLVDEGKLDFDKPVRDYLPAFKLHDEYASAHLTTRDMVTHRSGLPRHDLAWYNAPFERSELVTRLPFYLPNKELRQTFQYNNMMFITAGYLGGHLTGSTWEDAVQKRIFNPLGMNSTNFSVDDSQKAPDFALPYEEKDDEIRLMKFRNIDSAGPAGSINSNIDDMVRWLEVQLGNGEFEGKRIIQESTLTEMHAPQMAIPVIPKDVEFSPTSYGMGWMINTYQGHYHVRHGGNIDGFTAMVTLFPRDGLGIVALANKNGTALPALATRHAADRILGLEPRDWNGEALEKRDQNKELQKEGEEKKDTVRKKNTKPAHPLEEYAGEYEHPGYGMMKIEMKDDGLAMTYNNIVTPMEHWHYEVFNGLENLEDHTFEDVRIRFLTNMKGEVDAVAAPFELLVDEIIFKRRAEERMSDPEYLAKFLGLYELGPQKITIILKGNTLVLTLPGQPTLELVPYRDDEFNLKGLAGFSVKFVVHDDGSASANFNQPNGVFEAKRAKK